MFSAAMGAYSGRMDIEANPDASLGSPASALGLRRWLVRLLPTSGLRRGGRFVSHWLLASIIAAAMLAASALDVPVGIEQKFSIAVQKGNSELVSTINEGLSLVRAGSAIEDLREKSFDIYEDKKASFRDLLAYLIPMTLVFLGTACFFLVRRGIERKRAHSSLRALNESLEAGSRTAPPNSRRSATGSRHRPAT